MKARISSSPSPTAHRWSARWKKAAVRSRAGARRLRRVFRSPPPSAPYHSLSTRPLVLHVKDWAFNGAHQPVYGLLSELEAQPTLLLYSPSWFLRKDAQFERIRRVEAKVRARNSALQFIVLAPTGQQLHALRERQLTAIHCNQNAFVDEGIFRPLEKVIGRFNAVYDARLAPYKRHELAVTVDRLALITYRKVTDRRAERRYSRTVERRLASSHFFNGLGKNYQFLEPRGVNLALNQCRVGLCLSEQEGTMWASMQYLLAGLRVVTTPSNGGRDEFFDSEYVEVVAPRTDAVATGVRRQVLLDQPAPMEIHHRTVARMQAHRERLFGAVQAYFSSVGEDRTFREDWPTVFRHQLFDNRLFGHDQAGAIERLNQQTAGAVKAGKPFVATDRKP